MNLFDPAMAIYTSLAVALAVWIGIFIFLWRVDSATRELRRRLDEEQPAEAKPTPRATIEVRNGRVPTPTQVAETKAE